MGGVLTRSAQEVPATVASPCIGICQLDGQGLCLGCSRTLGEIAEWPRADAERQRVILREAAARRRRPPG